MQLLYQGAEARLFMCSMMERRCIVKERFNKEYRHPEMDMALRIQRTKAEARALLRAAQLEVAVPALYLLDLKNFKLYMELIDGIVLKDILVQYIGKPEYAEFLRSVMRLLGTNIARLHSGNLIHGDLTTSNFVLRHLAVADNGKQLSLDQKHLVAIDFGLSFISDKAEDKAVDLYVLERALLSTHSDMIDDLFYNAVLNGYQEIENQNSDVLSKLEEVRHRGRKRLMIG